MVRIISYFFAEPHLTRPYVPLSLQSTTAEAETPRSSKACVIANLTPIYSLKAVPFFFTQLAKTGFLAR